MISLYPIAVDEVSTPATNPSNQSFTHTVCGAGAYPTESVERQRFP